MWHAAQADVGQANPSVLAADQCGSRLATDIRIDASTLRHGIWTYQPRDWVHSALAQGVLSMLILDDLSPF